MVRTVRRRLVWNGGRIDRSGKNQSWCWQRLVGPVSQCALRPHRVPQANTPFFGRGRLIAPRISRNGIAPVVPGRKTRKQTDISQWERLLAASHHEVRQPGSETAPGDPREDNREYNAVCHCGSTKAALDLAQRCTEFQRRPFLCPRHSRYQKIRLMNTKRNTLASKLRDGQISTPWIRPLPESRRVSKTAADF